MKKILAMVTAVVVVSSFASAQLLKNFKLDGSLLEVNAYNLNNADFDKNQPDKTGDVDTRLILNMSFDLNDDANAVVTLVKNNRQWGTKSETINENTTMVTDGILNNLYVEQAYINLKGVLGMDHKLGRQFYGNPGDLVIYYGPKMWPYQQGNVGDVNAIDAFVPMYSYKDWAFTGIIGKEKRNASNLGTNLSGIDIKKKIDRFNLNAYYYYKVDNTAVPASNKLGLYGFRANWECRYLEGLNLGLEYDHNAGSDNIYNKYKGYAYKVNAGYTTDKVAGKLGLNAEYVYLSGDNNLSDTDNKTYTSIADDYRPGIIYGGFGLDTTYVTPIGTGAKVFKAGANWTPEKLNKLNLAFDYINAKVAEKNLGMKDTIGSEYDIVATWNHSDKISLKGYYAMFKPEKDNVSGQTDDMYTAVGGAFVIKF
jgi:hypothetical protein